VVTVDLAVQRIVVEDVSNFVQVIVLGIVSVAPTDAKILAKVIALESANRAV
jgi:hypothetical protein